MQRIKIPQFTTDQFPNSKNKWQSASAESAFISSHPFWGMSSAGGKAKAIDLQDINLEISMQIHLADGRQIAKVA